MWNVAAVTLCIALISSTATAQSVDDVRQQMILQMKNSPETQNLMPPPTSPSDGGGQQLKETGMVLTVIGGVLTTAAAAWIGYDAANPPGCAPASPTDSFNLGPTLCETFKGFRYMAPALVALSGAAVGITGGVLWMRGAKRLAQAQLSAGPGSLSLAIRW
jgi:hypothetical protein